MDYSVRWRRIKSLFSKEYKTKTKYAFAPSDSRKNRKEVTIWQRRFWEHCIRDDDYQNHLDYIHFNPVKHGLVERVCDWPWSSFHRYVEMGVYPELWGDMTERERFVRGNFGK